MSERYWLENHRLKKNKTQKQVSEHVGISRSFYAEIEKCIKEPKFVDAMLIVDFFNMSEREFVNFTISQVQSRYVKSDIDSIRKRNLVNEEYIKRLKSYRFRK